MQHNLKKYPFQNKSLKDIPGEKWREIPGWENYEVSNYGRVKSAGRRVNINFGREGFKKEKILSQQIRSVESPFNKDTHHYLCVGVQEDNRRKVFRTARLVYCLFVKKFPIEDTKQIIQYKNDEGLNIHPSNLLLTTHSEKIKKTIARNRTPRIKKVTQFGLSGKRIKVYPSMHQAARSVKGNSSRIFAVLDKWPYYYKGFLWRKGDVQKTKPLAKPLTNYPKKVAKYSLKGNRLVIYPSLNQAAKKVGAKNSNLRKAIIGKCHTCKGYKWKWAN